jgi:glycosyltransferase involved in cell wall biosynthesis
VVTVSPVTPDLADHRSPGIAPAAAILDQREDSPPVAPRDPPERALTALIAVPTLEAGAADAGVLDLVRILAAAGHRPVVASRGGRWADDVDAAGGINVMLDMPSRNPLVLLRNALALTRLVREYRCDLIHAHGRAPAWSAYLAARITGVPFLTTWYKGFREQNALKRLYNGVMTRGDRVIAVSDQLAELIHDRYATPFSRIAVIPASVDLTGYDPAAVTQARIEAVRRAWGVANGERIILVAGRMRPRKGHHVVVQAVSRLKTMGVKDFVCIFAAVDQDTRYAAELWDQVLAGEASDVIRITGSIADLPAAYAAATVVVSAAVQPEGVQRALLEAQAMARPVIVSEVAAGGDVVLAPPAVSDDRMTGLRFSTSDDSALASALIRLFSMPDSAHRAIGNRGRAWVLRHFNAQAAAELMLKLYSEVAGARKKPRK